MAEKVSNPYLRGTQRLADVITGIQFLGGYKYYKVSMEYWDERVKNPPRSGGTWEDVFREHPEFFRVSDEEKNVCLILRRARTKNYDIDTLETITKEERIALTTGQKKRITRPPLATSDITSLISTAVELHSNAMEQQKESRWFLPLISSGIGLAGVVVGGLIGIIAK